MEWRRMEAGMDKDRIKGSAKQAKGRAKEVAGKVFGDSKLKSEGKGDQVKGKVQNAIGGHQGHTARQVEIPCCVSKNRAPSGALFLCAPQCRVFERHSRCRRGYGRAKFRNTSPAPQLSHGVLRSLKYDTNLGGYRANLTKDQLDKAPKYSKSTDWNWNRDNDRRVHDYYKATPYWPIP